jgi:hypothetical protein
MAFGTNENAFGPLSSDDVIRAQASITATDTTNAFTLPIEAVLKHDLAVVLTISSVSGTSPTLAAVLTSTDTGHKITVTATEDITAAGNYVIPIPPVKSANWNLSLTIGGTTPDYNLGAYVAKAGHAVLAAT